MNEKDLLDEIGKVSEELIAAHALPDIRDAGKGGADQSSTAKEQIVMSEKKSEYIRNPFIRALPAIAAAAAVIAAGVIILPKTNLMRTPGASVESILVSETENGFRLEISRAELKVLDQPDQKTGNLELEAELNYTAQDSMPTVWYGGFSVEKDGTVLYQDMNVQYDELEASGMVPDVDEQQQESDPLPVALSSQGALPLFCTAPDLDLNVLENSSGDLTLTAYFKVGTPEAEPTKISVPVTYQTVKITGVEFPDITGWEWETAREALQISGLQLDKRSSYDETVPEGEIISSDPAGPATLKPGDWVRVIVSLGPNKDTVLVPAFTWMNWDMAQETAAGICLVLEKKEVGSNEEPGTVLSQSIQVGEEVKEGTVIELEVAKRGASDDEEQEFRFTFPIPEVTLRSFRIEFYDSGELVAKGYRFEPATLSSPITMAVRVSKSTDLYAVLVDEETGKQAEIGTYHIDYEHGTYELTSGSGELNAPIQALKK